MDDNGGPEKCEPLKLVPALGGWQAFAPMGDAAMMMGHLVLAKRDSIR
jgi:hypothetical protein